MKKEEIEGDEINSLSIVAITMTIAGLFAALVFGASVFIMGGGIVLVALVLGIIGRVQSGPSWVTFFGILTPILGLFFWIAFLAIALSALAMFT